MAITTLPAASDNSIPAPDHAFGATALTPAEWVELDRRPHGVFVLEARSRRLGTALIDHEYPTHREADEAMAELIRWTPKVFDPEHGPVRLVITQVVR